MSAEIKITAQTTPPAVVKVNGKCYSLAQAAVPGKPDTAISDITNTYATCAACLASGSVPATCPCSTSWGTFPCGGDGENILGVYDITIADAVSTAAYTHISTDVAEISNISYYAATPCFWFFNGVADLRVPDTDMRVDEMAIQLVGSSYWLFAITSGATHGIWVKRDGDNPDGTYTLWPNGTEEPTTHYTSTIISPTTMEISAP